MHLSASACAPARTSSKHAEQHFIFQYSAVPAALASSKRPEQLFTFEFSAVAAAKGNAAVAAACPHDAPDTILTILLTAIRKVLSSNPFDNN